MVDTTLNIIVNMQVEAAKAQLKQLSDIVKTMNTQADQLNNPAAKYEKGFKTIQKTVKQNDLLKDVLGEQSKEYRQQQEYLELQQKQLNINANAMNQLRLRTKGFSFDFLTLVFAGMMLQKTFGGMFNSIINSYKKVMGMNSQLNRSTLKMSASFEYLKFSIANALNNPIVLNAIEWLTDRLADLGDWFQDNPSLATGLLAVVAALAAFGALASIAGGLMQIRMLFDILKKADLVTISGITSHLNKLFSTLTTDVASFFNSTSPIAIGISLIASFYLGYEGLKTLMSGESLGTDLKGAALTVAGAALGGAQVAKIVGGTALAGAAWGVAISVPLVLTFLLFNELKRFNKVLDDRNKTIEEKNKEAAQSTTRIMSESILGGIVTGAAAGSVIPGVGTALGAIVGGIGGFGVGATTSYIGIAKPMEELNKQTELSNSKLNTLKTLVGDKDLFDSLSTKLLTNTNQNILLNTGFEGNKTILTDLKDNVLPKYQSSINSETDSLNRNTKAIEANNKALREQRSLKGSSGLLSTLTSGTKSTTTRN